MGVVDVLVIDHPAQPEAQHRRAPARELAVDPLQRARQFRLFCGRTAAECPGSAAPPRASAEAGTSTASKPPPNARRLASTPTPLARIVASNARAVERQHAAAGERAEQRGRDHAAAAVGDAPACRRRRSGCDTPWAAAASTAGRIGDAVARRRLLGDREGAVRGGDQRGAVRRDQAALDGAAGFHQLGGDHHVHVARHRHQRQHRRVVALRPDHLDVVDRGAGALRHAGHRGGLRDPAVALRPCATIQSASTPPPWPPIAMMAMRDRPVGRRASRRPWSGKRQPAAVAPALQAADDLAARRAPAAGPRRSDCARCRRGRRTGTAPPPPPPRRNCRSRRRYCRWRRPGLPSADRRTASPTATGSRTAGCRHGRRCRYPRPRRSAACTRRSPRFTAALNSGRSRRCRFSMHSDEAMMIFGPARRGGQRLAQRVAHLADIE